MIIRREIYKNLVRKLQLDEDDSIKLLDELANTIDIHEKSSYEAYTYYLWDSTMFKSTLEESFLEIIYPSLISSGIRKILCVGDGKYCRLSSLLVAMGFDVLVMDESIVSKENSENISYIKRNFDYETDLELLNDVDIILGHHPCGGAKDIILASKELNKPFIVALCCAPKGYSSKNQWYDFLISLSLSTKMKFSLSGKILYDRILL